MVQTPSWISLWSEERSDVEQSIDEGAELRQRIHETDRLNEIHNPFRSFTLERKLLGIGEELKRRVGERERERERDECRRWRVMHTSEGANETQLSNS